jgi:hypothetical protein
MDCYQTAADCVLIKTQLQPRKQTDPKSRGVSLKTSPINLNANILIYAFFFGQENGNFSEKIIKKKG